MGFILNANEITEADNESLRKLNILIGAKYMANIVELKLTFLALYMIQQGDYEEKPDGIYVNMRPAEIKKTLKNNSHRIYEMLDEASANMTGRTIGIKDQEAGIFEYHSFITDSYYKNGTLTVVFNIKLRDYLIDIIERGNWSKLDKNTMMSFKSAYSFRLYEILKKSCYYPAGYIGKKTNIFSIKKNISELKFEFGVINPEIGSVKKILNKSAFPDFQKAEEKAGDKLVSYSEWGDFKKRCLNVAINEINKKAKDITVSYQKLPGNGKGGKITDIEFIVTIKNKEENNNIIEEDLDYIKQIFGVDFSKKDLKKIHVEAKGDKEKLKSICKYIEDYNEDISNMTGLIISLLKNGYDEPIKKSKKGKSKNNNTKEREYIWSKDSIYPIGEIVDGEEKYY